MKLFTFIHEDSIHVADNQKIIPAEEFSTLLDCNQIAAKAKEDAEIYRKQVEKECDTLKMQAKQEGFQEGLCQFNDKLILFEKQLRVIRHEMQQAILPLALKAARKIVSKELELSPETIVDIVLQTLGPIKQNHKIVIYVNKADKEVLEANKTKIKQLLEQLQSLSILERADISPGGCVIETESGIINATIENQWRALEAAFERYMKF